MTIQSLPIVKSTLRHTELSLPLIMRWIFGAFLLFVMPAMAQKEPVYFTVTEGDTLPGHYTQLELTNGEFTTYAVLECPKERGLRYPDRKEPKADPYWDIEVRGEYENGKPSGAWVFYLWPPSCEGGSSLYWKRVEYLNADSLRISTWNAQYTMTADSSYIRGREITWSRDYPEWECLNFRCSVWQNGGRDTVMISFNEVLMVLETQEWRALFR